MRANSLFGLKSLGACCSVGAHVLFFVLMLGTGEELFQEERSAGAPDQVWGMTSSSLGVEIIPLHAIESAANAAEHSEEVLKPIDNALEEAKPTELREIAEVVEPVEEVKPTTEVDPTETASVSEAKPVEAEETVEGERVPEAFQPIAGTAEAEIEAVKPKTVETVDPEETELSDAPPPPPPPPPQEVAAVEQTAAGGPVGVIAGHGGSQSDTQGHAEISSYAGQVAAHLRRHKRYPPEAERSGTRGTVKVAFSVGGKGEVLDAKIVASSGSKALDGEALAMVSRAAPFPPVPVKLGRKAMSFTVPVRFQP